MWTTKRVIISIIISFIVAFCLGLGTMYWYYRHASRIASNEVVTKQISGEKISHDRFNFRGESITYRTVAEGKGVAETKIPKTLIPEARSWMTKVNGIECSVAFQYDWSKKKFQPLYGATYWHRFNSLALGAGIVASSESIGPRVAVMYWF